MAISTFAELKTALASELHRSDLTSKIPDFILMAESRLNRELRMLDMITTQTGTLSTSVATLALPTRYADKLTFRINSPLSELIWVPPIRLKEYVSTLTGNTGQPQYYSVSDTFEFERIPDQAYSYTLKYYKGYRLAVDADTNYLLTNYPHAYLYTSLIYAAVYIRDFSLAQGMEAMMFGPTGKGGEVATIKRDESRRKGTDDARLVVENLSRQSYDITRG